MTAGKQLKAAILARRVAKGPRKKRTRPKPRQYTITDLERARDRVAAAERRIDNDRTNNANRGRAGLERAQLALSVIESQLRLRGLLQHRHQTGMIFCRSRYGRELPRAPRQTCTCSRIRFPPQVLTIKHGSLTYVSRHQDPFARDVLFDPGGTTMPRITASHMLRPTICTVSASAT
jgi:hypothetical protein